MLVLTCGCWPPVSVWPQPGAQSATQCRRSSSLSSADIDTTDDLAMSFLSLLLANTFLVLLGELQSLCELSMQGFCSVIHGEFQCSQGREISRMISRDHEPLRTKRSAQQVPDVICFTSYLECFLFSWNCAETNWSTCLVSSAGFTTQTKVSWVRRSSIWRQAFIRSSSL